MSSIGGLRQRVQFAAERARQYRAINSRLVEGFVFWAAPQRVADATELSCRFDIGAITVRARRRDMVSVQEIGLDGEYSFVKHALQGSRRPVIIDGGANIGVFSALVLSLCERATVHAIEASRDTFAWLRRNQRANPDREWHPHHFALWDDANGVEFEEAGVSTARRVSDRRTGVRVPTRTLDEFVTAVLPPGGRIDLCKLDIEGAEERVLAASRTGLRLIDHLIVEVHPGLCSELAVRRRLAAVFENVDETAGRSSSKPLLHAFNPRFGLPDDCH